MVLMDWKEVVKSRSETLRGIQTPIREASPKSLFRLQIHRADLSAIKVIGFGQFGEVYMAKHVLKIQNPAPGAPKVWWGTRNNSTAVAIVSVILAVSIFFNMFPVDHLGHSLRQKYILHTEKHIT